MQKKKNSAYLKFENVRNLRPDLSGNPFLAAELVEARPKKIENGRRNLAPKKIKLYISKNSKTFWSRGN
jgi:hypothetical protein